MVKSMIAGTVGAVLSMSAMGSAAATPTQGRLAGKRIAILVTEGFEQPELAEPRKALDAAGAKTMIVSPMAGDIKAWNKTDWGDKFHVDESLDNAKVADYDALLLPGGVMNPDKLRMNDKAVKFVREFADAGKPIAAICHGPWLLVEAGIVAGRKLTSWPSLKTDIKNAGGTWTDAAVITDKGLVTSRKPDDIPMFNAQMITVFSTRREHATR